MKIAAIINAIEQYACPALQEKWDNTGLQVGSVHDECTGVLVCLDATPAVVAEAKEKGCNLIVSHHPLFFKPVKKLVGATLPQATALEAIKAGIAIYSSHTAADSASAGVNAVLAQRLGVKPMRVLQPVEGYMVALSVIVPRSHAEVVQAALFDAGAGAIGNYDCCSFSIPGQGTFRPLEGSNPFVGTLGLSHEEDGIQIQVVLPTHKMGAVESAVLEVHPYETPAYQFTPMLNAPSQLGIGIYGISDDGLSPEAFVEHVKQVLGCKAVRTTKVDFGPDAKIRRVALCGGAGGELIGRAVAMGAQAYVTADIRYHDFVDYRDQILLIDAGHFETEAPIKEAFAQVVSKRFPMVPVYCTSSTDNPINYQ
ncbi:MAG: Nif3-like dinuclear metal center hexameric protein [Bacteroidales bacterium]|nr:Nif3-like dinuclear metal center hexameric protein [Bacteroidales bacterium]